MRSRQNNLRTARFFLHILNIGAKPVSPAIGLPGNLLVCRKNGFGLSQIDNDVSMIDPQNDPIDDIAFSVHKTGVNSLFFSILHFLDNDLLCGLRRNSTKNRCIHFYAQAVAYFTFWVQLPSFFQAHLHVRIFYDISNLFELKDFDFTGFGVVLGFDINLVSKFFPGCGFQCFLKGFNQDILVNSLVSTYLFNHTLNVGNEHQMSPL